MFCNNQHLLHQKHSNHSTSKYLFYNEFFATQIHEFIYSQSIFHNQAMFSRSMFHRWSYKHFSHDDILKADLKIDIMKNFSDYYSAYHYVINCQKCIFEMRVDKWRYTNFLETHDRKSFQCFLVKSCLKHALQQQVDEIRITKKQQKVRQKTKQRRILE